VLWILKNLLSQPIVLNSTSLDSDTVLQLEVKLAHDHNTSRTFLSRHQAQSICYETFLERAMMSLHTLGQKNLFDLNLQIELMKTSQKRIYIRCMDTATPIGIWISDTVALFHALYSSFLALWLHAKLVYNSHLHSVQKSPNSLQQVTLVTLVSSSVWFLTNSFSSNVKGQPCMKTMMHAKWSQIQQRPLYRCVI
jgi:hypothetical protein